MLIYFLVYSRAFKQFRCVLAVFQDVLVRSPRSVLFRYLQNMSDDPHLAGTLLYQLPVGKTMLGDQPEEDQNGCTYIQLKGLGVEPNMSAERIFHVCFVKLCVFHTFSLNLCVSSYIYSEICIFS